MMDVLLIDHQCHHQSSFVILHIAHFRIHEIRLYDDASCVTDMDQMADMVGKCLWHRMTSTAVAASDVGGTQTT